MAEEESKNRVNRRDAMRFSLNTIAGISIGGIAGLLINNSSSEEMVWQLDPDLCIQCENCWKNCVLPFSAVKCVNSFSICGYCDLCPGYLEAGAKARNTGAENQLCPTGALKRKYVEDPYFEYTIDEKLCIACAKCVKGCEAFGNGSLYLQVQHDRCVNCNDCLIARSCPPRAFKRVPAITPYILRGDEGMKLVKKL